MSGRRSRDKGAAYEREDVRWLNDLGIDAYKVPLSGAAPRFKGDIQFAGLLAECKRTRRSRGTLYKALAQGGGSDLLFVRDNHCETLVVMPPETFANFCRWSELAKKYPSIKTLEEEEDV